MKVAIISDTHYHDFSRYATVDKDGVNSRLADIMRATKQAANHPGVETMFHGGDVFHVRGTLTPTVLNPVSDMYAHLNACGLNVFMMPGNHDLKSDNTKRVTSNVTPLESYSNVSNKPGYEVIGNTRFIMIPWEPDLNVLRDKIQKMDRGKEKYVALIIHAPLNGVLDHLPAHGLNPSDFDDSGITHVFCGHYHNHRAFPYKGGTAYSIGALTHQNWGDVGSKAGYIIYDPDTGVVEHHETSAPKFVKVDVADILTSDQVIGNYVKVIGGTFTNQLEVEELRDEVILMGARAVEVEGLVTKPAVTRSGTATTAPGLSDILADYIDRNYPGEAEVKRLALEFIKEVE